MNTYTHMPLRFILLASLFIIGLSGTAAAQDSDGLLMPDWMSVDNDKKQVNLNIIAGKTDANNNWNYNGMANGEATIVVPEGYTVVINFKNNDPLMMHSIGLLADAETFPPIFEKPTPVFTGAISSNATDMASATKPGESEELTFIVDKAGKYALICLIPAHAVTGMWIGFNVSADGKVGLLSRDA